MKHKIILAIDPGPVNSGFALLNGFEIKNFGHVDNYTVKALCKSMSTAIIAIEGVMCYNKKVGASVFGTCKWIGRFIEAGSGSSVTEIYQSKRNSDDINSIRAYLTGSNRARKDQTRDAVLMWFAAAHAAGHNTGAWPKLQEMAKTAQNHIVSALAVAITCQGSAWYRKECGP